jgi:hypothetical protein
MEKIELYLRIKTKNELKDIRQRDIHYIDFYTRTIYTKDYKIYQSRDILDLKEFIEEDINYSASKFGCNCSVKLGQ